jgi:hypothetical protein
LTFDSGEWGGRGAETSRNFRSIFIAGGDGRTGAGEGGARALSLYCSARAVVDLLSAPPPTRASSSTQDPIRFFAVQVLSRVWNEHFDSVQQEWMGQADLSLSFKLAWFQDIESMLNHQLAELLGLGSLSWAGHQIHGFSQQT